METPTTPVKIEYTDDHEGEQLKKISQHVGEATGENVTVPSVTPGSERPPIITSIADYGLGAAHIDSSAGEGAETSPPNSLAEGVENARNGLMGWARFGRAGKFLHAKMEAASRQARNAGKKVVLK